MVYGIEIRERAVSYIRSGGRQEEASRIFGVSTRTLYNWLRAKDLTPRSRVTRRGTLDKTALAAHVRDYPDALLRERAEHFGVSHQAVWMAMKKQSITKKNDAISGK